MKCSPVAQIHNFFFVALRDTQLAQVNDMALVFQSYVILKTLKKKYLSVMAKTDETPTEKKPVAVGREKDRLKRGLRCCLYCGEKQLQRKE